MFSIFSIGWILLLETPGKEGSIRKKKHICIRSKLLGKVLRIFTGDDFNGQCWDLLLPINILPFSCNMDN